MDHILALDECVEDMNDINMTCIKQQLDIWYNIYGNNAVLLNKKLEEMKASLREFWLSHIQTQKDEQDAISKRVERKAYEVYELEKALGIKSGLSCNYQDSAEPLIELENSVDALLSQYEERKQKLLTEYDKLKKQEEELLIILTDSEELREPSLQSFLSPAPSPRKKSPRVFIPSEEEMESLRERVQKLDHQKSQLEEECNAASFQLRTLLYELERIPFLTVERFACNRDMELRMDASNLKKMQRLVDQYTKEKNDLLTEAEQLREEISRLWNKLNKDPLELQQFLNSHAGYTKSTLKELKQTLQGLKEERKCKLKDLILQERETLEELWTMCCYSDDQRSEFKPFHVEYFSEEVLNFHELEVERLQNYFEENKQIFELAEEHSKLWQKCIELENKASQPDRLFSNRGGRLLQEEKERKVITKKIPCIKTKLLKLLSDYKRATGNDFLYFGSPLLSQLERLEEEREEAKENLKKQRQRKVAAASESTAAVGSKRKIMTPQQPTTSSKVMKLGSTTSTASSSSSKSRLGTRVLREMPVAGTFVASHTPTRHINYTPMSSTPHNGAD